MIGEERVRLIDSSDWMHGIGRLNELVEWLACDRSCFFLELLKFNIHDQ